MMAAGERPQALPERDGEPAAARGAAARKSATAFRTISEVSEALDVPQHVLRFWETKFAQIKPMKRGGGRRYYRPEDIVLLRGIRDLLYVDGYTIKGVQKLLRESGVRILHERTGTAAASEAQPVADADPPAAAGEAAGEEGDLAAVLDQLEALRKLLADVK